MNKKAYIIILNWNGWKDTIECLESVFQNLYSDYRVVLCDNASTDKSLDKIKQWADGTLKSHVADDVRIDVHVNLPVEKPIRYIEYNREQAESGGFGMDEPPLILIQTGDNLGFAGGNNVGIRYVLARDGFEYIWLLNNDTVIKSDALIYLIQKINENPSIGMCGSTLLYYHEPDKIQALGGATYNEWLGISKPLGAHININSKIDYKLAEETKIDYIVGASMLVKKQFIKDIGLLCEEYFLYYEEIDWAIRAHKHYKLAYASASIVYHKDGASTGGNSKDAKKSMIADYYGVKNKLVVTRKFFYYALPVVYIGMLVAIVNRIRRKQWDRVKMIVRILCS